MLCLLCVAGTSVRSELTREKFPFYEWRSGIRPGLSGMARDGQEFDCATWLHQAGSVPKDQFKREVEMGLTGGNRNRGRLSTASHARPSPIIEQTIETAALMLGTHKSRGYCLEMICADFLAGANLENEDPTVLLQSMSRFFKFLPGEQRQAFLHEVNEKAS